MRRRFIKSLEDRAKELAADISRTRWDTSIPSMLRREIALTVEQMEQLKFLTRNQMRGLLRQECDIHTEIMQHKQGIPWYTQAHFPDEQAWQQRLFEIEKERRKLITQYHDKLKSLEDHLLSLINKHEQLDLE